MVKWQFLLIHFYLSKNCCLAQPSNSNSIRSIESMRLLMVCSVRMFAVFQLLIAEFSSLDSLIIDSLTHSQLDPSPLWYTPVIVNNYSEQEKSTYTLPITKSYSKSAGFKPVIKKKQDKRGIKCSVRFNGTLSRVIKY